MTINNIHILLMGLLFTLLTSSIAPLSRHRTFSYHILQPSKLFLTGSTNINSFTCNCARLPSFPGLQFNMEIKEDGLTALFKETQLKILSKNLDCGNRQMNKDLYQTLKAGEYPSIDIRILEAELATGANLDGKQEWAPVRAKAKLAIAGASQTVLLKVKAKRTSQDVYRFLCNHTINMADFDIEPPSAMLGLIKVNSQIDIHFDLLIAVDMEGL